MVTILPENPSFGAQIGRGLGSGLSKGFSRAADFGSQIAMQKRQDQSQMQMLQEKAKLEQETQKQKLSQEYEANQQSYDVLKDNFGEKFADIWLASPQGAKTELTRAALEARARGIDLEQMLGGVNPQEVRGEQPEVESFQETETPKKIPEKKIYKDLDLLLKEQDEGLLPSEKISRGKERFDVGLKQYQEAGAKLRSMAQDKERLNILEDLDKSKKLPKNLERLNVDKEGNLRLAFAASPEAQRFVKTLNEFSSGAKDTFGSRVTNFDLSQYLKRFPTLLNSSEGRRQLIEQMKIVNKINSVYYKNLKNVYDKAGGARKVDADVAERFAEQLSEDKINDLVSEFKDIGEFTSKPSASEFKGKRIRDKETGEIFVSDGENWVPAE